MVGGLYVVSLISYLILGSTTLQEWNLPKIKNIKRHVSFDEKAEKTSELKPINLGATKINEEDC